VTSTDPYTQCVEAMMTALRTLTTYFPKAYQVSFDPYNITRGADYWFWVSPFVGSSETRLASRTKLMQWATNCQLDVRYTTEADSAMKIITARGAITTLLNTPRLLKNINVNRVIVVPNGKPLQDIPGTPNFLIQALTVTIEQIVKN
jgi:hypothetical protein